ncbi:MAG: tetraacyldisaccharide 4'-kinase, partial [Candidatus Marinimicrobia bacterium]|nr:tetraacyldisaccharide 4'-kinase [Candidatus Neomarinimicrobiota bacterium]
MLNRYLSGLLLMVLATCAGPVSQTGKFAVDSVPAYESAWQADLASAQTLFNSLKTYSGPASVESTLTLLNDLEFMLFKGSAGAELMANVHPAEEMRSSAEQAQQAFSNLATELGLSREAYDNVVAVDVSAADAATQRYHANTIRDFKRAGVDQDAETRAKIRALQEELVVIGQDFGKNIREDVRSVKLDSVAELAGLPDDFIAGHQPGEDGMITITTDYPDYLPYMTYAESDARRFELYIVYKQRGYPANVEVLEQMIARRHELANLLGYETWADYITSDKMIGSAQAVAEFIERVNEVADPASEVDYQMLFRRLKKLEPDAIEVGDWQKTYLGELVQLEEYSYDSQEARQYFAYDKVRDGL